MKNAPAARSNESALDQRHCNPLDLFPDTLPPVLPAAWPTAGTRAHEALTALFEGPQNQAEYSHGWRLAAYVKDLEYDGWAFLKRDICRPGCRRAITEYRIDWQAPAVAAALRAHRQAGCITPELALLLVAAAPLFGVLLAIVSRWFL